MLDILAITVPIYLIVAAGYLATRNGLFERADMRVFGKYMIWLALPAMLFNALSQRPVKEVFNPVFLAAFALGGLASMAMGIVWARKIRGRSLSASAIMGMGMSCPNSGFIGFPLVAQVFGAQTGGVGLALAMLVENFILLPTALAIADADTDSGGSRAQRLLAAFGQSARGLMRNPMIHGVVLGFLFAAMGWRLPAPVARAVDLLAASCGALSLFVIGGSLVGIRLRGMGREVLAIAFGKLLLHPLAVLCAVVLLPPMQKELQLAVVLMAAVPMLGIYPIMAQKHGHDAMAAAAQLVTTVLSFFTLTSLLWVMQRMTG